MIAWCGATLLLRGGGLGGFGVSWTTGLLSGFNDSIADGGRKLVASGETAAVIGPLLWVLGKLMSDVYLTCLLFIFVVLGTIAAEKD